MFASIAGFAKFVLLFAIWLFFLAGFALYTKSFIGRLCAKVVQIGTFADVNDSSKDLSAFLITRADELSRPVSLDALYEVKVPPITNNFGAEEDLKFLDDVKLSFQGVDVPSVIRSFFSALPDHYTLSAKTANLGAAGPALNMELKAPSGGQQSWILRVEPPVAGAATPPPAAATTGQVIDRAIYTIWYYMYYDPKGLHWRKNLEANFTSARALEAYYGGQQRLASYQRTFEPSDLDEAEKEFELLSSEMPDFVPGLMFLGSTLLEKRSEADAIKAFERAQQLLAPNGMLPATATAADRKTWLQARLFVAVALLQMYRWQDNHKALRILERLKDDIPTAIGPAVTLHDLYDYRKIRFSVLFQIAHTVGHDLTLLDETTFVDALTEPPDALPGASPTVPSSVRPVPARQATLRYDKDAVMDAANDTQLAAAKARRAKDFGEEITRIFEEQQSLLTNAEDLLSLIDQMVNDSNVSPNNPNRLSNAEWGNVREKSVGDLRNADGYARFRYAQTHDIDDIRFREDCKTAISKLLEAKAVHPNDYTVLQNLGLIYADPRFDSTGNEIDSARALFARSLEIKRRDYFGYEQLAKLSIRQAYEWGPEFVSLDAIKAAIVNAEKARELRPGGGTIFALLAQLYVLKWTKTTGTDQQDAASMVDASLAAAERTGARQFHLRVATLQWQLSRLRASANKAEFDKAKTKFLASLHTAETEANGNPRWDARDLVAHATQLRAKVQCIEFDDRSTLRWLN